MSDLDDLATMDADPEVMRFILDGVPPERVAHRLVLNERIGTNFGPGLGIWSVFAKPTRVEFLGWVCLVPLPGHDLVEIGWRFRRAAWGQGYATEAAGELLRHGFDTVGLDEIVAVLKPENRRSLRNVEKLGMTADGMCRAYDEDLALFRLQRPTCS